MKLFRLFRLLTKVILVVILLAALAFGFVYLKYQEDLPSGVKGAKADALAHEIMDALEHEAYDSTRYIEWSFRNSNHYQWNRITNNCEVKWKDFKVLLDLDDYSNSKAFVHNFQVSGEQGDKLIEKAVSNFNNDSFWLVAPYKLFDPGTVREIVELDTGEQGLLITYTSGGTTPGDSYLWLVDSSKRPRAFKMWTSVIPVGGLPASWDSWIQTESGAWLPDQHKILGLKIDMGDVKGHK